MTEFSILCFSSVSNNRFLFNEMKKMLSDLTAWLDLDFVTLLSLSENM